MEFRPPFYLVSIRTLNPKSSAKGSLLQNKLAAQNDLPIMNRFAGLPVTHLSLTHRIFGKGLFTVTYGNIYWFLVFALCAMVHARCNFL